MLEISLSLSYSFNLIEHFLFDISVELLLLMNRKMVTHYWNLN